MRITNFFSLLRTGAGLRCELSLNEETEFHIHYYSVEIQQAVYSAQLGVRVTGYSSAELKGNHYKKGDIVTVRQEAYQYNVEMGMITIILCDNTECLYLVLEILETTFNRRFRLYELGAFIRYECLPVSALLERESLHVYLHDTISYVKINHGLVASPLH